MAFFAKIVIALALLLAIWERSDGARIMTTNDAQFMTTKIECFSSCWSFNFSKGSGYDTNRDILLEDLETKTVQAKGHQLSTESPTAPIGFGVANCSAVLTESSCTACIQLAGQTLQSRCRASLGAVAVFGDCFLEYNSHPLDQ